MWRGTHPTTIPPKVVVAVSRSRNDRLAATVLGAQLGAALAIDTAIAVVAPPRLAAAMTVACLIPLWGLAVRAVRIERESAPRMS